MQPVDKLTYITPAKMKDAGVENETALKILEASANEFDRLEEAEWAADPELVKVNEGYGY